MGSGWGWGAEGAHTQMGTNWRQGVCVWEGGDDTVWNSGTTVCKPPPLLPPPPPQPTIPPPPPPLPPSLTCRPPRPPTCRRTAGPGRPGGGRHGGREDGTLCPPGGGTWLSLNLLLHVTTRPVYLTSAVSGYLPKCQIFLGLAWPCAAVR